MNLREMNQAKLAKVKENLATSQLDEATSKIVLSITESILEETVDDAEKIIKETEDELKESTDELEKSKADLKETQEELEEAKSQLKEATEGYKLTENQKQAIGALVKFETRNYAETLKEMKAFEAQKEAISSLVESTILTLHALGHDVMVDANTALVESAKKNEKIAVQKYNDLVAQTNRTIAESNTKIAKMRLETDKISSQYKSKLAESIMTAKTSKLTIIDQEKVKALVENKKFENVESYEKFLDESISSLDTNGVKTPLVTGKLNENQIDQPKGNTKISDNPLNPFENLFV